MGFFFVYFLKLAAWIYFLLPEVFKKILTIAVGFFLRIARIRRKIADQNLLLAFPQEGAVGKEYRRHILVRSYRHLARLSFEILMLLGPMELFVRTRVSVRGFENWIKANEKGKGVIFLSGHVGNWEIMLATGGVMNTDLLIVTKRLKPRWLHRAIESGRLRCGVQATYEPQTFKQVLSHLKKNGTVGFVMDQYAGPPIGIRVPFFGVPVGTSAVVSTVVKRTGAAVLPVVIYREKDGGFVLEVRPALSWIEGDEELALNTAQYASILEQDVRAHPEQWLWIHRRFKGNLAALEPGEWSGKRIRR